MSKMTKSQKKRMVRDIQSKAKKLYLAFSSPNVVSTKDMEAIDKLAAKWLNRIG